jgi:hypothetical protein
MVINCEGDAERAGLTFALIVCLAAVSANEPHSILCWDKVCVRFHKVCTVARQNENLSSNIDRFESEGNTTPFANFQRLGIVAGFSYIDITKPVSNEAEYLTQVRDCDCIP